MRRPDFRPTADLVVDVEIAAWKVKGDEASGAPLARLYTAPPSGDDEAGGTVMVRAEAPLASASDEGVTLALVIDTSASIEPALFDAERALVEAVLAGLGARDRAVVLAADQTARPVGPAAAAPSTRPAARPSRTRSRRSRRAAPPISGAPSRRAPTRSPPTRPRGWWSTWATAGPRWATPPSMASRPAWPGARPARPGSAPSRWGPWPTASRWPGWSAAPGRSSRLPTAPTPRAPPSACWKRRCGPPWPACRSTSGPRWSGSTRAARARWPRATPSPPWGASAASPRAPSPCAGATPPAPTRSGARSSSRRPPTRPT